MIDILNKVELDAWFNERKDHPCHAVKGPPPKGMTYDDGEPVINSINLRWRDEITGETIAIIYGESPGD